MRVRVFKPAGIVVALGAALLFPVFVSNPSTVNIAVLTLMYVGLASSWNIIGGFAGYISLGHSAFFGIGAYALGVILEHTHTHAGYLPFAWLPAIGVFTAICAIPIGWVALRTRHAVFATATIAIMFAVQLLATNLTGLTGGAAGLAFPVPPWSGNAWDKPFFYAMLACAVFAIVVAWVIRRSGFGLGLLAIRDDEDKAEAIGVPTRSYKLTAFAISAGLAGMLGGVYGYDVTYIYPQFAVDPLISIGAALMVFLGGAGTLIGPVLGALILEPSQLELSYRVSGQVYLMLYAGVFLVVILLMPKGIIPSIVDGVAARRARPAAAPTAGPAAARS
jgi:branched-chain amino acid transport system permease protein